MTNDFTPEQSAFVEQIDNASSSLAEWVRDEFRKGSPLDEVRSAIRRAMTTVGNERA